MKNATSTATTGSADAGLAGRNLATPPILVLGLGNLLLGDDGVGLRLLEDLAEGFDPNSAVEFLDGGTQGLALTGYLADRAAVLVLDAVGLGQAPGTVHVLWGEDLWRIRARRATTAHEGNALELFETARMLGYEWDEVAAVGIEPRSVRTGIGLTPEVESALDEALLKARKILDEMIKSYVPGDSR
jgi:hydrogenase maturation protease